MLTFKGLLQTAGIDPGGVRLARHQDRRGRRATWDLWRSSPDEFELYQRIQKRNVFDTARHVASFVATPDGRTLFVGLYSVDAIGLAPEGTTCPLRAVPVGGLRLYELTRCDALRAYSDRLVVDWGPGHRTWVQRADRQEKPIV
ncbi:MAG: GIY-YIG nuclease family protein, partial [Planctomycetota bacterium]